MKRLTTLALFLSLWMHVAHAASLLTYEGLLTDTSGNPITTAQTVSFQILYSSCILYSETQNITPGSAGEFSVVVGNGVRTDSTGNTPDRIFASGGSVACQGSSAVSMSGFTTRALRITVGGTTMTPDVEIGNIPVSINSQKLADKGPTDFLQVNAGNGTTQTNLDTLMAAYLDNTLTSQSATNFTGSLAGDVSGTQSATVVNKIKGISVDVTGIANGKILKYNGTGFVVADDTAGGVSSVTVNTPLMNSGTTAAPVLGVAIATTTSAGVVQVGNGLAITAGGVLASDPASFPSLVPISKGGTGSSTSADAFKALAPITTKGDLIVYGSTAPSRLAIGPDGQVLTADSGTATGTKWSLPVATDLSSIVSTGIVQRTGSGSFATLGTTSPINVTGANLGLNYGSGLFVNLGSLQVDTGTTANKVVMLDSSARLPSVDGSQLTNVVASGLSSTVSITQGGTGATTKATAFNALSPLNSKGDLLTSDGSTSMRLPAGANGQMLVTDSAETAGLKWIVPNFFTNGGNTFGADANLGTNDGSGLNLKTAGATRLAITSTGNVGIGVVSPSSPLVVGSSTTTGTKLTLVNYDTNKMFSLNTGGTASSYGSGAFAITDDVASKTRFVIDQTGAAALGGGTANLVAISTGPGVLTLNGPGTAITDVGSLEVNNSTSTITGTTMSGRVNFTVSNNGGSASTRALATIQAQADGSGGANGYGGKLTFTTKGDNATSSGGFFTMAANGNIGIGAMIAPTYKLDVIGDVNISTGSVYRINGTQICSSAGCLVSSDRRLKENIQPLENSLNKILRLEGVSYNYNDKNRFTSQEQVGVIAQDVEQIYPEIVITDEKTGLKAVAYDHLVAPLIEAVKSLYAKVVSSEQKIEEQDRKIASIENQKADRAEMDKLRKQNEELRKQNEDLQKDLNLIKKKLGL